MTNTQKFLNTTTHSVAWIYKRYGANELAIKPPFQRNPVWSDNQKAYLIGTILQGYPIPEIYMQEYTDSEGNDHYVLVDGQQRIRSCIDFIEGKFSLDDDDDPSLEGLYFGELNPDQRQTIFNYSFVVRRLPQLDDKEIRAIFKRLNRNVVALNQQELRHATYWGPFIKLMERVADDSRWSDLNIFTPNDIRRMLDVEYVSELAIAKLHGQQNKKDSLEKWYKLYEEDFDQEASLSKTFNSVLGELDWVFSRLGKTRFRKKSDFYTLFSLFAQDTVHLPLSSDKRESVVGQLRNFGDKVDAFLADPPEDTSTVDEHVRAYARAVERAASDVANRKERLAHLRAVTGL
jgi:hypothetical protein